jgi:hypothetical protein
MGDLEHSPGWRAANRALWLLGTAVVAAHGVALLLYAPAIRAEVEESARRQMAAEHEAACDRLGCPEGSSEWETCLKVMLQLQERHERSYAARTSSSF